MLNLYANGFSFEEIIHDLWYALQAEAEMALENTCKAILEEYMNIIKSSKIPEPVKFCTLL